MYQPQDVTNINNMPRRRSKKGTPNKLTSKVESFLGKVVSQVKKDYKSSKAWRDKHGVFGQH